MLDQPLHDLSLWTTHLFAGHAPLVLFLVLFVEEAGIPLPIPGDAFLLYAGLLVAQGRLGLAPAICSIVAGVLCGASILYALTRRFGRPFLRRYGALFSVDERRVKRVEALVERWGPFAIIVGRHVPGFRVAVTLFAALFGVPYPIFLLSAGISTLLWAALFLTIGAHLGTHALALFHLQMIHLLPAICLLLITLGALLLLRRLHVEEGRASEGRPAHRQAG
jgi:membrane protein DedA with SNARE-associated domain